MADEPMPEGHARCCARVVGLGLIVVLVLAMLFVVQQLRHASAIQDCVASGRTELRARSPQVAEGLGRGGFKVLRV